MIQKLSDGEVQNWTILHAESREREESLRNYLFKLFSLLLPMLDSRALFFLHFLSILFS